MAANRIVLIAVVLALPASITGEQKNLNYVANIAKARFAVAHTLPMPMAPAFPTHYPELPQEISA